RFLELTKTVEKRKMHEQYLDTMELERERGITIKLQPVKMSYESGGQKYILNLIDTPGHVDFSYEVSRSLAAVEGAILLVDASKGVQAQTLANLHLAQQQGLKIIPVLNKIDLPNARTEQVKEELSYLLAVEPEDILEVSAKNGTNVEKVLERIIKIVPPPKISDSANLKALIFDSTFDAYKGVIAYIRVFEGSIKKGDKISAFAAKAKADVLEAGYFSPNLIASDGGMSSGEIGYIATGLKDPGQIRVGDTITNYHLPISNFQSLPGYKEPRPMVFASFFPENNDDYDILKDALGKLKLTDASLVYEPESSAGLGRGFRLGFLGMLHVEIISERLKREFGLSLIISSPSVEYAVKMQNGEEFKIRSASMLPDFSGIKEISEPIVYLEVLTPTLYMGSVMELISTLRNVYKGTDYLGKETALLKYEMPLSEVITDFYDKLKSVSSGYASMSYEPKNMQEGDLVRLDILIAKDLVEPFSRIVPKEKAYQEGRAMVTKLKEVVPPQMFEVSIQAAIGGKVIAAESIRAKRKDVTQHMYGGDITRRMKLWKKQKRGKERMKETGRVNLPQDVFLKMLKR
ncbi:MAG: elongation factor 4, partial [Candidatus Yanofskybacteria bacterium RIFCSPLOWO2_12_FULL_43_11b]